MENLFKKSKKLEHSRELLKSCDKMFHKLCKFLTKTEIIVLFRFRMNS